ncbi:MAG: phage terminase small subunit P27 family [Planctomycetota bacterium]
MLDGNPGKRPLNKAEPKPDASKPTAPKHIKGEARKEWNRISKLLHAAGLLTQVDRTALAAYCETYARWVDAEEKLKATGMVVKSPSGYPMPSPYLPIANRAMKDMKGWLAEFGMTPAARSKVVVDDQPEDELTDFLKLTG